MTMNRFIVKLNICLLAILLLGACNSDDVKQAPELKANKDLLFRDRSYDVEVIYSDSAKVKAKGRVPILDKIKPKVGYPYQEMPKGVFIEFYDQDLKVTGSLSSDYAVKKDFDGTTIFRKNVVLVGTKGTYNTEELIWNENTRMYTSASGTFTQIGGTKLTALNFSADQNFSTIHMNNGSGQVFLKNQLN